MMFNLYIGGISIKKSKRFFGVGIEFRAWVNGPKYFRFRRKVKSIQKKRPSRIVVHSIVMMLFVAMVVGYMLSIAGFNLAAKAQYNAHDFGQVTAPPPGPEAALVSGHLLLNPAGDYPRQGE